VGEVEPSFLKELYPMQHKILGPTTSLIHPHLLPNNIQPHPTQPKAPWSSLLLISFRNAPCKLNTKNKFFHMQAIIHVFEIPTI
jgi:hypothetical protein